MKTSIALCLILSGCASVEKQKDGYIIDQFASRISYCDSLPQIQSNECYRQFSKDFRLKLKNKYACVTDSQMSQEMLDLSKTAFSVSEMGRILEDRVKHLNN